MCYLNHSLLKLENFSEAAKVKNNYSTVELFDIEGDIVVRVM